MIEELRRRNYDPDPVRLWKLAQDKNAVLEQDAEQDADLDAEDDLPTVTSKSSDFDYLLDMPMRSLTYEKKEDLLKKKEAKLSEYEFLRSKTPADLWCEDLDHFLVVLQEVEDSELEEKSKKTVKMPMLKQKKKQLVAEVLPSPKGKRTLPFYKTLAVLKNKEIVRISSIILGDIWNSTKLLSILKCSIDTVSEHDIERNDY